MASNKFDGSFKYSISTHQSEREEIKYDVYISVW